MENWFFLFFSLTVHKIMFKFALICKFLSKKIVFFFKHLISMTVHWYIGKNIQSFCDIRCVIFCIYSEDVIIDNTIIIFYYILTRIYKIKKPLNSNWLVFNSTHLPILINRIFKCFNIMRYKILMQFLKTVSQKNESVSVISLLINWTLTINQNS